MVTDVEIKKSKINRLIQSTPNVCIDQSSYSDFFIELSQRELDDSCTIIYCWGLF